MVGDTSFIDRIIEIVVYTRKANQKYQAPLQRCGEIEYVGASKSKPLPGLFHAGQACYLAAPPAG